MLDMPYTTRVKVIALAPDSDASTGAGYTFVTFALEAHTPRPPAQLQNVYPPIPRPVSYKHVMHLFFPTTHWHEQYGMWDEFDLTIEDNGEVRLVPVT